MAEISKVVSREHIHDVAGLAREIWTQHYVPIIGQQQVDYMLEKFQSEVAIAEQIATGYEYYVISHEAERQGYMAIVPDVDNGTAMLSKIYVRAGCRGLGLGQIMLAFAEATCNERGISRLWLTVNKHNLDTLTWYLRRGFSNQGPIVQDIGGGFIMDDFRLEKLTATR